jgi:hypothetical protein
MVAFVHSDDALKLLLDFKTGKTAIIRNATGEALNADERRLKFQQNLPQFHLKYNPRMD